MEEMTWERWLKLYSNAATNIARIAPGQEHMDRVCTTIIIRDAGNELARTAFFFSRRSVPKMQDLANLIETALASFGDPEQVTGDDRLTLDELLPVVAEFRRQVAANSTASTPSASA